MGMLGRILAVVGLLLCGGLAHAQGQGGSPVAYLYCYSGSGPLTSPANWTACSATSPLIISQAPYPYTPLTPMQAGLAIASSTALTIPSGATYAVICARSQNVDYTTDGTTTPTSSVGMQLLQNQCVSLSGATVLANFRAIQQAATATLDVSYFK